MPPLFLVGCDNGTDKHFVAIGRVMAEIEGLNFTALDFMTANYHRASACALGAVKVKDGVVIDHFEKKIHPHEDYYFFDKRNIAAHGMNKADVEGFPEWDTIYSSFRDFAGDDLLVAHNSGFDMSVFRYVNDLYGYEWPINYSACTLMLSRRLLDISGYSLEKVVNHLDLANFEHTNVVDGAQAAANVMKALVVSQGVSSVEELMEIVSLPLQRISDFKKRKDGVIGQWEKIPDELRTKSLKEGAGFVGQTVCFTGKLGMVRSSAQRIVLDLGGVIDKNVTKNTTVVVTGDFNVGTFKKGMKLSNKVQKAIDYLDGGQQIEIMSEDDFLQKIESELI